MSIKFMAVGYDLKLAPTLREVYMAYADHADHEGRNIYPSVDLIAWKLDIDERTVRRATKKLVQMGILVYDARGGGRISNKFHIDLSKAEYKPPFQKKKESGQFAPPEGTQLCPPRVDTIAPPDPSLESIIEPLDSLAPEGAKIGKAIARNIKSAQGIERTVYFEETRPTGIYHIGDKNGLNCRRSIKNLSAVGSGHIFYFPCTECQKINEYISPHKLTKSKYYPVQDRTKKIFNQSYTWKEMTDLIDVWRDKHQIAPLLGSDLMANPKYTDYVLAPANAAPKPPNSLLYEAFGIGGWGMAPGFNAVAMSKKGVKGGHIGTLAEGFYLYLGKSYEETKTDEMLAKRVIACYAKWEEVKKDKTTGRPLSVPRNIEGFIGWWNEWTKTYEGKVSTVATYHPNIAT